METQTAAGLTVTETAAAKLAEVLEQLEKPGAAVRVYAQGRGQFGMSVDEHALDGDVVLQAGAVTIRVDPASWARLEGATVDWAAGERGEGFVIRPARAHEGCGCGGGCGCGH
ncbi:iron-sulfur cluster assembly accessory protein [Oceanithermus sp.]|uniref:HesB/IscA family protein n=1 Tax=Oceanithermus sp. TaxID=2268145 RepID=UPI0025ED4785|nr:iron-sulfur cluster assembly accessory protein [Oceanithermus sp.]